jgi:Fanconi anemia group M protein
MSWLTALEGVSIIYSRDQQDSADLVYTFARHLQHGLGYEIPLRSCKPKDLRVYQQYMVEGLPGVGPGRARALVEHFGSVRAVLTASAAELAKAPGMGAKTAQKIVEVLEAQWN